MMSREEQIIREAQNYADQNYDQVLVVCDILGIDLDAQQLWNEVVAHCGLTGIVGEVWDALYDQYRKHDMTEAESREYDLADDK